MIAYETYRIVIEKKAQKFLEDLPKKEYKKLHGYKNLYRLRIDDYHAVFAVIPDFISLFISSAICHAKYHLIIFHENCLLRNPKILLNNVSNGSPAHPLIGL